MATQFHSGSGLSAVKLGRRPQANSWMYKRSLVPMHGGRTIEQATRPEERVALSPARRSAQVASRQSLILCDGTDMVPAGFVHGKTTPLIQTHIQSLNEYGISAGPALDLLRPSVIGLKRQIPGVWGQRPRPGGRSRLTLHSRHS
jgi:hypothetical protein